MTDFATRCAELEASLQTPTPAHQEAGKAFRDVGALTKLFVPYYLTPSIRISLSRHTGVPIFESHNPHYGYWATFGDPTREQVVRFLGAGYVGNMRQAA
jgi:hypothetical protein